MEGDLRPPFYVELTNLRVILSDQKTSRSKAILLRMPILIPIFLHLPGYHIGIVKIPIYADLRLSIYAISLRMPEGAKLAGRRNHSFQVCAQLDVETIVLPDPRFIAGKKQLRHRLHETHASRDIPRDKKRSVNRTRLFLHDLSIIRKNPEVKGDLWGSSIRASSPEKYRIEDNVAHFLPADRMRPDWHHPHFT